MTPVNAPHEGTEVPGRCQESVHSILANVKTECIRDGSSIQVPEFIDAAKTCQRCHHLFITKTVPLFANILANVLCNSASSIPFLSLYLALSIGADIFTVHFHILPYFHKVSFSNIRNLTNRKCDGRCHFVYRYACWDVVLHFRLLLGYT